VSNWVLLLPPSEIKSPAPEKGPSFDEVRRQKRYNAFPELDGMRTMVIKALQGALERRRGLEQMFEVRGEALEEAIAVNRRILEAHTLAANQLYRGVMYESIDWKSLPSASRSRLNKQTLIFSGLFGLLRPTDRIPPYKLKMSANLGGLVGKVVNFWRVAVSEILRQELKGKVVWDFLPDAHKRAWDGSGEILARHQVKFVKRVVRSGVAEWKTISHHSKALKGALVRYLVEQDATDPRDLRKFTHPDGYKYVPSLSVESKRSSLLVFAAE
jgi:cytoplasmic iron level regulating protein YaaA (DUF328/UPF0246 family)